MKKPEDDLLGDLFPKSADEDFRSASLERTVSAVREHRRRRKVVRVSSALVVAAGSLVVLLTSPSRESAAPPQVAFANSPAPTAENVPTVPGTGIRIINDEELLAMFANRPVALIGPPEDRQFVVLDEVRKAASPGSMN